MNKAKTHEIFLHSRAEEALATFDVHRQNAQVNLGKLRAWCLDEAISDNSNSSSLQARLRGEKVGIIRKYARAILLETRAITIVRFRQCYLGNGVSCS